MENRVELSEYRIEGEILYLKLRGFLNSAGQEEKVRASAVFSDGVINRYFPVKTEAVRIETGGLSFTGGAVISLPDIFYSMKSAGEDKIRLSLTVSGGGAAVSMEAPSLERRLFLKEEKRQGFFFGCYKIVSSVASVCLLPWFLLDGFFAVKGYKRLDVGENPATGLKAVFLHANALTKRLSGFTYSVREWKTRYLKACYQHYKKRPVKENQILFLSERLLEEHGNLALIKKSLEEREGFELTEFISTKTVNKLSFSELRTSARKMAEAKVIILEDFYPQLHALRLREETKVVQLWHACGAFKTFGFSRLDKPGGPKQDSLNHRSYDLTFVSGKNIVPIYSEAFGIPDTHVIPAGVPRTDLLFNEDYKEGVKRALREKYRWLEGSRVVLFAPTFRGTGNKTAYYPTERINLNQFMEKLPEDCVLIVKNHPFVKDKFSFDEKWKDRIFDLTGQDNINDILLLTDLLITDYSSSIFEAALLSVPMVFYVFDKEEYLKDRDIYYDFDFFAPGELAATQQELEKAVQRALNKEAASGEEQQRTAWFKEEFLDALDGSSVKKVTDCIVSLITE